MTIQMNAIAQNQSKVFYITKIKNKKKWTNEEDALLISLAGEYKEKHWKNISKHFTNKNPLQCFSRYKRIRPGIVKGSWTKEEDEKILELVRQYGKSWSKIAKVLTSRNGKQIRDRFTNVLDPEIKKGKFSDDEDKLLIKLYISYGPKWAIISKNFPSRTADMIKNRFHSSIKKIFFTQEMITRQTKSMISLKEKKMSALKESEVAARSGEHNIISAGQCFSLRSTRPSSLVELTQEEKKFDSSNNSNEKSLSILYNDELNMVNKSLYEDINLFDENLNYIDEFFTYN